MSKISVSARSKVQSKTSIFSFSLKLQCYVQLADLLVNPLPHFCYRRPPGTLVRKAKHINKSRARGRPRPCWAAGTGSATAL